ncbi:aggregation-promoting factor C-terminal-like domain-containing protein [Streptomyces sp. NPDC003015]
MATDLDIVGTVGVDVVPVAPTFHDRLKAQVLPAADRIGEDVGRRMGEAISRHIVVTIPDAVTDGGRRARVSATREGGQVGGAFGNAVKRKLEEAFRSLPRANVRLGDTGLNADLDRLRARIQTLSGKTIGIDIDAGAALAEITAVDAALARISAENPDVNVRVDTAAARAALAEVQRQINDVDRDDVNVRVDVDTAGAIGNLRSLGIALGAVAAIPVIPVAAAGIGAIASAAVAAGAGVGALALAAIPAIKGVTSVIQAKTAADKEAAAATDNSAASTVKGAQRALQMASAQQALTAAHRNAARSIAQASRQVEDAERAVAQAIQRASDQRRQAAENIERAEQSLADAHRGVQRAEQSLADAQRQSTQAQADLTQARADAARQLADLNDQLERGKLDERDATLRVKEAQEELNRTQLEYDAGRATDLQMERAQLAYDQSVEAAKQQKKDYAQLQKDADAAKKAGVDGNDAVKQATDRVAAAQRNVQDQAQEVADAQRNVQDQAEAVADAQRDAARVQVEAAQSVSDAQRSLSDAVSNAANTQVQAAESIASAERGIESARLSSIDTTTKAVTKADEYRKALAKLTPEQRDLFDSIAGPKGLTAAFKAWSKELQPDVLPLFTRGVDGAKNSLPGLSPLVKTAADAVGELMDRASASMKSPFWQGFKADIAANAKPAIIGLGVAFGNVLKGMAGIVDAFLPHMDGISATMQRITGRFAKWGAGLKGSPEFENFLQYVKDNAPGVAEFLGDLIDATIDVTQALEPMSRVAMAVLSPLLDGISWISQHAPGVVQILWGMYAATNAIKLATLAFAGIVVGYNAGIVLATLLTEGWTAALVSANLAFEANPVVALVTIIVAALAALVLGIIWAYKNVGWFRDIVDTTWKAIATGTTWLWENILRPFLKVTWEGFKQLGDIAVWLWKNAIWPAFQGIWLAAKIFLAVLITLVITPIWLALQALGVMAEWLWKHAFKPAFEAIGKLAVWLYKNAIKPQFDLIAQVAKWLWEKALQPIVKAIWDHLKWLGDKFLWLYSNAVKPSMNFIADKAGWLYEKAIKPQFKAMRSALDVLADAFRIARVAIGKQWDQLRNITKAPVNFLIKWVYTNGVKAVWDRVAKYVGLSKLPDGPKLLEAGGTVGDGWSVARPMKTNRPTAIVGEGNPRYPEYVIPTDPKYRGRALSLHRQAGTQLLESGGILGGAWDWTKDTFSDIVGKGINWAKTGADLLTDPSKIWSRLMKPILGKVNAGVGSAPMGKALAKYPGKMADGLKDKILNAVADMFTSGGGVGQWAKPVSVPYGTRFGVSGSMWSSGHHTGLDFPAAIGTAVKAVAGGTVSSVGTAGPYGNHLEINHGGGLSSLYAHLSKILVGLNQHVAQGQQIGKVGATGNVTGPHLHLEARLNGKSVDPMPYLTGGGAGTTASKSISSAKSYAKGLLGQFGWGPDQFPALEKLWQGESGWRWNAENRSSGAYGIPQALPGSKMASAGSDWKTSAATQIRWGLDYIKHRPDYGSPSAAYAKWLGRSPHWYDDGGMIPPGLSLVANGTGKPEPVFTGSQWDDIRAAKSGGATAPNVVVENHVWVGDREITDIVDHRITVRDADTGRAIEDGRYI